MHVSPASLPNLSSALSGGSAAVQILAKEGENAASAVFAPVEEVSLSAAVTDAGMRKPQFSAETYSRPRRNTDTNTPLAADAAERTGLSAEESQQTRTAEEQVIARRVQRNEQDQALADAELQQIRELKQRDQEVRAHEQAHASSGGPYTGSADFTYQQGPDGVRYAVGGEVSVDVSKVANDPAATLAKMEQVQRAALAPAEPSSQDRQVAAQAGQIAAQALSELTEQQRDIRAAEQDRIKHQQEKTQAEMTEAREKQEEADKKLEDKEPISVAERFAEHNARLRKINEVLLQISLPPPVTAGQLLNDIV
ncbi:MAG: hypothetical protein LRY66_12375 [Saccharospirillaceae bacterium]|nr:hypothetical protein [Saccharospirillaceae bacterium]MCD8532113.1 hypothetical protein [Saccharospirillaceae bacterium]